MSEHKESPASAGEGDVHTYPKLEAQAPESFAHTPDERGDPQPLPPGDGQVSSPPELADQKPAAMNPPNPFKPERFRRRPDFEGSTHVKKVLTSVAVRKPSPEAWVRVHPDPAFELQTGLIVLKDDREIYIVEPPLWPSLESERTFCMQTLYTSITRQGTVFLWHARLPDQNGRLDSWNKSAHAAAELAKKSWVRVTSNLAAGSYDAVQSQADIGDATWPVESFDDIFRIAFRDRVIDTFDHPVLRKLRGEI